jgi:dsDNA-specific endonuclease/ATPase MutS2
LNSLLKFWGRKIFPPPSTPDEDEEIPQLVVVTNTLDLHGYFPQQVPQMLEDFIQNGCRLGLKEVKIIHGKGRSRLKGIVWEELERNPLVESYRDAHPLSGGWGATIAVLKVED